MHILQRFLAGLLGVMMMSTTAGAHDWEEVNPRPNIILERLVEIFEASAEANRFASAQASNCVPHHCLEIVLGAASEDDFKWLKEAPEAEIPSNIFGRIPANMTYEWMFDLVMLLDMETPTKVQSGLIKRVETTLTHWTVK